MKNYVLALASMLSLAVVSCKKDSQPDKEEESKPKYAVQFNFNEFTLTDGDFGGRQAANGDVQLAKDTLKKYAGFVYYLVYDASGSKIRTIIQNSKDPDFGLVKDSLPQGQYTVAVLATKDSVALQSVPSKPEYVVFSLPGGDAFYKRMVYNIDGDINETINLSRIMAKLSINIKDKMPSYADNITVFPQAYPGTPGHTGHYSSFDLKNGIYAGVESVYSAITQPIPEALRNTTNTWFDYYILAVGTNKIKVGFTVEDNNDNVLGAKTVLDVTIEPNRKTTLYGNLFSDLEADTTGVGVIVDPSWGDSTNVNF